MSYEFVYTRRPAKDIQKLDEITKKRIDKTLVRYGEDPLKYTERLIDSRLGDYRFRTGDYRVIFDMDRENIVVLRVGHRKQIYKR